MKLVDVEGTLVHETKPGKADEGAYLFDFGGKEPVWLPKSACEWDAHDKTMTLPERLATDKGIV